jgi:hypothetical protein
MKNKELERFFYTLFDDGDEICLSKNKFGYFSVPLKLYLNEQSSIDLIGQKNGEKTRTYTFYKNNLELVSVNAVSGARLDKNVTKFRTFLIEIDDMPILEQAKYIVDMRVPVSVAVFSGNKSIHFAVSLVEPVLTLEEYTYYAKWLLNIVSKADQNTKNPTRSIRIPFIRRKDTGKMQDLLYNNGRVSNNDFISFLNEYKDLAPKMTSNSQWISTISEERLREIKESGGYVDVRALPIWALERLKLAKSGQLKSAGYSRNNSVFSIAFELFKLGYPYDIVRVFIADWFPVEHDFSEQEMNTAILSALKKVRGGL